VDNFVARTPGKRVIPTKSPEEFVRSLERPRKVILLVKAGDPVDWTIDQIKPFLEAGTSSLTRQFFFRDTERREKALKAEGFNFIGSASRWREGACGDRA